MSATGPGDKPVSAAPEDRQQSVSQSVSLEETLRNISQRLDKLATKADVDQIKEEVKQLSQFYTEDAAD